MNLNYLYLGLAILAEVIGTTALQASQGFTKLVPSIIVVAGYSIAFYGLSLALKTIPIGVAYAIWSGVGTALIAVIGWAFLKQRMDGAGIVGIALIIAGVAVLNLMSKSGAH